MRFICDSSAWRHIARNRAVKTKFSSKNSRFEEIEEDQNFQFCGNFKSSFSRKNSVQHCSQGVMDWNLATLLTKVLKKHFKILELIEKSIVSEFDSRRKNSLKWLKDSIADPTESFFWDSTLVVILKWILTINCGIKYRSTFQSEVLKGLKVK